MSGNQAEEEGSRRSTLGKVIKAARTVDEKKVLSGRHPREGLETNITLPVRRTEP